MKTPFHFRGLAALLLCLSSALATHASHLMGGDLRYEYAGTAANPNQYHVTAMLFLDNSPGVTATQDQIMLSCGKNECGVTLPGSFTTMLVRTQQDIVSSSSCSGNAIRYSVSTLEGNVQLPPGQWTLSINGENRSGLILNMAQAITQSQYVQAELDNSTGLANSSPRFNLARLIQLSGVQSNQRYSLSAFDSEGDSLAYQLVQPLAGPSTNSACSTPIAGALAPHFQLDAATGTLLTLNGPTQQGRYCLAARVDEYRKIAGTWQRIGSITRDMTYFVQLGSSNQLPAFSRVALASAPTAQLLGQTIRVNPGQTLSLVLTAADADAGQALTLSSTAMGIVPGATFQSLGNGQALLTWQVPANQRPGRYFLTAAATDNACPIAGAEELTLAVQVTTQALATRQRLALAQLPYPTPFEREVQFRLANPGQQSVTITDGLGRVVAQLRTAADGSLTWRPAPALTNGLYFARTPDGTQVARLAYTGH
ncbi:hypothetical protein GCM10022409_07520 [Hymenobacter glaciei]|uniref:Secretion system C-terminal sorting domain-containing protein n=1 Tax=Hymenobacter glaciei TaxID=877209 RepID=A0ABP7TGV8_9BACT